MLYALCFFNFALGVYVLFRLQAQERQMKALQSLLVQRPAFAPSEDPIWLLAGLKVAVQIEQDHERPILAQLLKTTLAQEDVAVVSDPDKYDVLIRGKVKCNGYEELFFEASFECQSQHGLLFSFSEKPVQGGRQANLAIALVAQLKREWTLSAERAERLQAFGELRG